jgi:hypothetical protein
MGEDSFLERDHQAGRRAFLDDSLPVHCPILVIINKPLLL